LCQGGRGQMMGGGQEAMTMVRAYVLIQTEVGQAARVAKEVAEVVFFPGAKVAPEPQPQG
jgi:hypothetical protein